MLQKAPPRQGYVHPPSAPMDALTLPAPASRNLRAFRRAEGLSTELFWITRRFPQEEQFALTDQLRRTARTIQTSVAKGWNRRYSPCDFRDHIAEAQSACARLGLWLYRAYACDYLTAGEYRALLAQKSALQQMLLRLYDQRIALLD